MAWSELLYSWLVYSALASLAILIFGSGAALLCRQPVRRLRIIELALTGCLVVPWLGMVPGYPRLAFGPWNAVPLQRCEVVTPLSVEQSAAGPFPQVDALSPCSTTIREIRLPKRPKQSLRPGTSGPG